MFLFLGFCEVEFIFDGPELMEYLRELFVFLVFKVVLE